MNTEIASSFSNEYLSSLFATIVDKYGQQVTDFMDLLIYSAEENEKDHREIKEMLAEVLKSTQIISSKIDAVLEKLITIEKEFADVKTERRDVEEKLTLMMAKLQKIENSIPEEDLEEYKELAKRLYVNWDSLELFTKKYIPLSEYLYSKLQKIDGADYSPVVLELCRAIENEFLRKIFSKYTMDLLLRKGRTIDAFLVTDKSNSELIKKTQQFVAAITRANANRSRTPEYTLGQMSAILSMLNDESIVSLSPLLQDFETYLGNNTEMTRLLNRDYIQKIKAIVKEYRNPSAHPDFMSVQKADECRGVMPERIDYLIECVG